MLVTAGYWLSPYIFSPTIVELSVSSGVMGAKKSRAAMCLISRHWDGGEVCHFQDAALKEAVRLLFPSFQLASWNSELPLGLGEGKSHTPEMVEQRADNEATELRAK